MIGAVVLKKNMTDPRTFEVRGELLHLRNFQRKNNGRSIKGSNHSSQ